MEDEGENYPLAIDPILKGSYVDNISGGAETPEHLQRIASQLNRMCLSACLPQDKWKSNCKDFSAPIEAPVDLSHVHSFENQKTKIL